MTKLIQALQIFARYADLDCPTHCEHDMLCVVGIPHDTVSEEDCVTLDTLGFFWNEEYDSWCSFRYGSA